MWPNRPLTRPLPFLSPTVSPTGRPRSCPGAGPGESWTDLFTPLIQGYSAASLAPGGFAEEEFPYFGGAQRAIPRAGNHSRYFPTLRLPNYRRSFRLLLEEACRLGDQINAEQHDSSSQLPKPLSPGPIFSEF